MNRDFWERLVQALRVLFPFTTSILLICLGNMLMPSPTLQAMMPELVYPAVWIWMLRRPDLMHFSIVFFLGLFADLLSSNLIGVTPLCLLILHRVIERYDRFFRVSPSLLLWLVFSLFVFASLAAGWLANSVLYWTFLNPTNFALKALSTALVMPICVWILTPIDRFVLGARERAA